MWNYSRMVKRCFNSYPILANSSYNREWQSAHFSTWFLSLAESWLVKKVSQRAAVRGISKQQERWDRDESWLRPFLQLSAGINPRLIPLHVWLQQGHDLQRSQILQVSPVINQSNMSRVLSLRPIPPHFTERALIGTVALPHLYIHFFHVM